MRAVVQRVLRAAVTVGDRTTGQIERGLLVFVGVERGDGPADVQYVAAKVRELRVFEDPADPSRHVNLSVRDVGGSVLVVSQFTLAGDCRKGRRPSFDQAAPPDEARPLYDDIVRELVFNRMVERGLADVDAGRTISDEEMERSIESWRKG